MTATTTTSRRPPVSARRAGYVVGALVNAVLLFAVNRWPGWEVVPFLTGATPLVLGLVNASFVVSMVVNVLYLFGDPGWFRALGDVATTTVGLAAMVRLWQVFPFDFDGSSTWETVARVLLGVGIVGSIIGILAGLVRLVKGL